MTGFNQRTNSVINKPHIDIKGSTD